MQKLVALNYYVKIINIFCNIVALYGNIQDITYIITRSVGGEYIPGQIYEWQERKNDGVDR